MAYRDYYDTEKIYRRIEASFEIELSNTWTVLGHGSIFFDLDDIEKSIDFESCYIDNIVDKEDNDVPQDLLDGELEAEFDRKYEEQFVDFAEHSLYF